MITGDQLARMMPHASPARLAMHFGPLTTAMQEFDINTPLRVASFLAQVAHESCELRYTSEVWGPTEAQKRYDPPFAKAHELGNTQPGDGFKYRGAGPLQLTGKANFKRYGDRLGLDLVNNPDLARGPLNAFRLSACFWRDHGLNELADQGDFLAISRAINLGNPRSVHMPLGNEQREAYFARNRQVLGC